MMTTQTLDLRQSLQLRLSQKMQQAIKLLQMSNQELCQYVDNFLLSNPLLEYESDCTQKDDDFLQSCDEESLKPQDYAVDIYDSTYENVWQSDSKDNNDYADFRYESISNYQSDFDLDPLKLATVTKTLHHTIKDQIESRFCGFDQRIALEFLSYLEDSGYLHPDYQEIQDRLGLTHKRFNDILNQLQQLEPTGIFSRSLSECLSLQLKEKGEGSPLLEKFLKVLSAFSNESFDRAFQKGNFSDEEKNEILRLVKSLQPKPGYAYGDSQKNHVVPDLLMKKNYDEWIVELNAATLPKVLLNSSYYLDLKAKIKSINDKAFLQDKFYDAKWLVKSLHTRAENMLKIATTMINFQKDFFNHQKGTLKPLCLKDIAVDTGLSESTVSRILNEKYILTPKGNMLLKELLSTAISSQVSDNDQSSKDIQQRLKELISQEKANKPYSDQEIVMLLKKDGVSIARRTIAKYRMVLGFGSALERKNLYGWRQNAGNQSKTGT